MILYGEGHSEARLSSSFLRYLPTSYSRYLLSLKAEEEKRPAHTMGAIDPIQMTDNGEISGCLTIVR